MKSRKLLSVLLASSMIASVALTGCGGKDDKKAEGEKSGENAQAVKMDKEQYLNVVLGAEPKTLDPSKATDLYSSQVLANTMEALTRLEVGKDGKDVIKPGAAKEWKKSEDGLKWTFTLRDMKWSDGQAVTAEQFVYGITRTLDQKTGSQYAFLLFPIKNANEFNTGKAKAEDLGVKAIDEKTIEFTLASPCAYFLDLTYFKVMEPQRKDIIEKHGDKYGSEVDTMVFSGPFIISEWVHNNKVELVKNKDYWDAENVKLEKATMKIIKEETARMNELYNGSLDAAAVTKQEWVEKFNQTGKFEVKKGYDGSATYTFFNQKDKYFANAKIRKAFIIANDRAGTASTLFRGLAEPANAWCPPAIQIDGKDYRETATYLPVEELKKANSDPKALLIEGLKELGLDPDPAKHTFKVLQSGTDARAKEFAEFDQQNYSKALGVNIECDYAEWAVFQKRTDEGDYQIAGQAWGADYNDPNTFFDMFMSEAGICNTGWKSEKYDSLIKEAGNSIDPAKRLEKFKEAEKLLVFEDGVISPGVWRFKNTFVRKYIKNYMSPTFGALDLKYTYTEGRE
ncbi:peptide ABC transporter substrate-binding protein [Clostridium sp. UBA4548]|uniref:peptide ABC transporter substrate-binding protein n=1 Tax=Clostridium sp. UBA4548 TaxID=1946361 RepID=UPI0025C39BEC|nr:peptide ABC transporter substrate-binding protein [Clostridium sp. UBA4548]